MTRRARLTDEERENVRALLRCGRSAEWVASMLCLRLPTVKALAAEVADAPPAEPAGQEPGREEEAPPPAQSAAVIQHPGPPVTEPEAAAQDQSQAQPQAGRGHHAQRDAEVLRLVTEGGMSRGAVARELRLSKSVVQGVVRRAGLVRPADNPVQPAAEPRPQQPLRLPRPERRREGGERPLQSKHCQYISGEPSLDDSCKCGAPVVPGKPYCQRHYQRCYVVRGGAGAEGEGQR